MRRSFGTHDGSFHADEVTACALLLVFDQIDRTKIVRTRDPKILKDCEFVCDVGGIYSPEHKRFDHHQVDYTGGLSSAGMVWKYLKESKVVDLGLYEYLNDALILGVDAHDNGRVTSERGTCTFSHVISNFIPPAYDATAEELSKAFFLALDFAVGHLQRLWTRFLYIQGCCEKVLEAMRVKGKVLVFDEAMPWMDVFFENGGEKHPALFVIMPSGQHWKLRGIPPNSHDRMKVRVPLPEKWAGLMDEKLKQASGISGAIFCHKERFISIWETKEDAMKALEAVLRGEK